MSIFGRIEYHFMGLYEKILQKRKQFAVLIDPDRATEADVVLLMGLAAKAGVDYFFVGGSLLVEDRLEACLARIKGHSKIPAVLFPGSPMQVSPLADGILFLSMISGRNPELLIGQHVIAAPYVKKSGLEVLPTGYMLVDGGRPTTVSYMSQTAPIPADKDDIAVSTALAGELLGLKLLFLDAGSGALNPVPSSMIRAVREAVQLPLIVGGGIRTPEQAALAARSGADVIVVGNVLEKEPGVLGELVRATKG